MHQIKDPSGNGNYYEFGQNIVKITPSFIYEITLHKYWKNGYSFLGNKFYSTDKLLNLKKYFIRTNYKDYFLIKEINLIGVPESFIKEHQLNIYIPIFKSLKKKTKKK